LKGVARSREKELPRWLCRPGGHKASVKGTACILVDK
jgi:hypothetical protein